MDTAQWPQQVVVKPMGEILPNNACSKPGLGERRVRPQKEQALNCPRCNSTNTKFCYYNNYSLSQPRYFCKTCRRYWTEGGSLRNIPVGGGSRKNKRSSSSSSSATSSSVSSSKKLSDLLTPVPNSEPSSHQNPKIHEGHDLNLGFTTTAQDFKTMSELITVPNFDTKGHIPSSSTSTLTSSGLSALDFLTGFTPRGMNSYMPVPNITDPSTIYSSGFPLPEFKPSLNFSLDGLGNSGYNNGSLQGVQESNGRLLFPFVDLKQVSNTTAEVEQNSDQHGNSTGYWNGMLGGGSW